MVAKKSNSRSKPKSRSTSKRPEPIGSVAVFGGGIAGLTAAHALVQLNFEVTVIETDRGMGPDGKSGLRLGGMARSQYSAADRIHAFDDSSPEKPDEAILAGEHGFRFFPSYYHNVWDTLQSIPIYDAHGERTERTVFDNLVPDVGEAYVAKDTMPFMLSRSRPGNLEEIVVELGNFLKSKGTAQDLQTYTARLVRYLTTCSERREKDCEDISFIAYLSGRNSPDDFVPVHYSEPFRKMMANSPRVLAALNASYGDARTNLDTAVQLTLNMLVTLPKVDGVLNAPTTEAWFIPWRYHLEQLGVKFVEGCLQSLALDGDDDVHAWVTYPKSKRRSKVRADYFVVATDAVTAQNVTGDLPPIGVPGGLRGFTTSVPPSPFTGEGEIEERDPYTEIGLTPWDRYQTCTGIQYFFREPLELVHGHIYMGGSPWGLTAIAEQAFWTNPPTLPRDGYQSVLSVDVCVWETPGLDGHPPASQSTRHEIAHEVWRQILDSLPIEAELPEPAWYTLDHNILFSKAKGSAKGPGVVDGHGLPVRNLTPYLVPIAKDWDRRPGADPWNPGEGRSAAKFEPMEPGLWQAGHGGYLIHWRRLVFAGVYKKTFTRLTTMEAACESGRHAVNAIIDHYLHHESGHEDLRTAPGPVWSVPQSLSSRATGYPIRRPSPIGDYCNVWNIENHEIADFDFARQLDRKLFEAGLPHLWESIGLDHLVAAASKFGAAFSPLSPHAWPGVLETLCSAGGASGTEGAENLLKLMRALRELLESMSQLSPDE